MLKKILSFILVGSLSIAMGTSVFAQDLLSNSINENSKIRVNQIDSEQERVIFGDTTILDTTTENNRTIITNDGVEESVYFEDFSSGIATLSVNGRVIDTYNMDELRKNISTWIIPKEDALLIDEYFCNSLPNKQCMTTSLPNKLANNYNFSYTDSGIVVTPIEKNETSKVSRATTNIRKPYDNVTEAYPTYMYKQIESWSPYSSVCNRYLNLKVKDSMYNYVLTSKTHKLFRTGTALSVICGTLKLTTGTVMNSLIGLVTVIGGVMKLSSDVDYYYKEEYSFNALRQGYVYDYTNYNQYVSVNTKNGKGKISMTWDFINDEYTNPEWKITAQAYPHTITCSKILSETKEIWEYNMQEFGVWKWGNV